MLTEYGRSVVAVLITLPATLCLLVAGHETEMVLILLWAAINCVMAVAAVLGLLEDIFETPKSTLYYVGVCWFTVPMLLWYGGKAVLEKMFVTECA